MSRSSHLLLSRTSCTVTCVATETQKNVLKLHRVMLCKQNSHVPHVNQKQMRTHESDGQHWQLDGSTVCDLNITRLPTPHVNKQYSPSHYSWNSHTVFPGHPPHQSAHYWMLAKQVSDHSAWSGNNWEVEGNARMTDHYTHTRTYETEEPDLNPPSCTACRTFGATTSKALMRQPTAGHNLGQQSQV